MRGLNIFGVGLEALFAALEKGIRPGLDLRLFEIDLATSFNQAELAFNKGKHQLSFSASSLSLKVLFHNKPPIGSVHDNTCPTFMGVSVGLHMVQL